MVVLVLEGFNRTKIRIRIRTHIHIMDLMILGGCLVGGVEMRRDEMQWDRVIVV